MDEVFSNIGADSQDLLITSRKIYDDAAHRLVEEQGDLQDQLYKLMMKRTRITDPYLRGRNQHINACESGKAPMQDSQMYFDAEMQELKDQLKERNQKIFLYALGHPIIVDQECSGK